jgi:TRAP-type mannitol/chloroaromatic compound transport system substrate-binding protein
MNRRQFLGAAGAGAAGLVGAGLMGSNVASAWGGYPDGEGPGNLDWYGQPTENLHSQWLIKDMMDEGTFHAFINAVKANAQIDLQFVGNNYDGFSKTVYHANVGPNGMTSGSPGVNIGSGLASRAGDPKLIHDGLWLNLYFNQPFMNISLIEFVDWLYYGGGLELRQEFLDENFGPDTPHPGDGIIALPIRINPGEGGGWYKYDLETLDENGIFNGETWKMRISGEIPVGIIKEAFPSIVITGSAGVPTQADRFDPDHPNYLNALEYHIPSTDNDALPGIWNVPDIYYYLDCWWSTACQCELWINKNYWNNLTHYQRSAIEMAAKKSVFDNLEKTLAAQVPIIRKWEQAGVTIRQSWPEDILDILKAAQVTKFTEWRNNDKFEMVLQSMANFLGRSVESLIDG